MERGSRAAAYELQGEIFFSAAEEVSRRLDEAGDMLEVAVLDLHRVKRVDPSVVPIFADLVASFADRGAQLAFSGVGRHSAFIEALERCGPAVPTIFQALDLALEWCESRLLQGAGEQLALAPVELDDHELLRGLTPEAFGRLESLLVKRQFETGALAVRRGDRADELFLISRAGSSVGSRRCPPGWSSASSRS